MAIACTMHDGASNEWPSSLRMFLAKAEKISKMHDDVRECSFVVQV
jgi:hypothetical protein